MLLPSDAIQVLERTPSKIVVWDPPNYSFGVYLLVLAVALLSPGLFLLYRRTAVAFASILIFMAVPLAAFASFLLTSQRFITISRADGMLTVKKSKWGFVSYQAIPMGQIRRVTVKDIKYGQSLVVVTKSGEALSLGNATNRKGYYGASDALNDFLGVTGP